MTSQFRSRLIADIDGGLPYTLFGPLIYDSAKLNRTIIVPTGFKTDLASIPRVLWSVLPPMGGYSDGACVHDYCYQTADGGMSRGDADGVLNEAMAVAGVGRFTRWVIYAGIRSGGWVTWGRYRDAKKVKT